MPQETSIFGARLEAVEARIQKATERSGRVRSDITLVAVSKKFSAAAIRQAYEAGLRDFGENYVQEFSEKRPELGAVPGARFHLIGHLQSNKARDAVELFDMVQAVDSPKLLRRLESFAAERNKSMEVFVEVKLSSEEKKTGAPPEQIPSLLEVAAGCPHLRLTGLMTMPPWSEDPEASRPYFRRLAELAREYKLNRLSMGMSHDFEVAIEEGATVIRVGTAIFGARPKH